MVGRIYESEPVIRSDPRAVTADCNFGSHDKDSAEGNRNNSFLPTF